MPWGGQYPTPPWVAARRTCVGFTLMYGQHRPVAARTAKGRSYGSCQANVGRERLTPVLEADPNNTTRKVETSAYQDSSRAPCGDCRGHRVRRLEHEPRRLLDGS